MAETVLAQAPPRFVIVAHSLGGIAALQLLATRSLHVDGAVLIATSARAPTPAQRRSWADMEAKTAEGRFDTVVRGLPDQLLSPVSRGDPALRGMIVDMARSIGPSAFLSQLRAQQGRRDLRAEISRVRCPVLVVSGEADTVCPPERQAEIAAAIPGAVHKAISDAGHLLPLEAPGELAAVFSEWTAGHGASV